jgi:ATP-dependent exoDNAse (exonuclease V) beta subunit
VRKQHADLLIDNLNKTYVAFTRPRTELHILSAPPSKSWNPAKALDDREPAKNLSELMSLLAPEVMTPMPGQEGRLPSCYEFGTLSSRDEIQSRRSHETSDSERVNVTGYPVMPLPHDLCVRVENASSSRIKAGIRLHSLLSRIHDRDDVDRVIVWGLKHGIITQDPDDICGLHHVNANVRQPIMDPASPVAAWFDPANRIYSERTITSASDSLFAQDGIENLRPDRIVRRPDGTIIVIDYKSGDRDDKRYLRQLRGYLAKLRLIFPDAPIAGRLWYVTRHLILDEQGHAL